MEIKSLEKISKFFERNALTITEAKAAGRHVVGTYCIYAPAELILAAGAIPVSLCGTRQDAIPAAEVLLPRSLCPLIKSSYGYLLNDSCPYLASAEFIVAETTCDGKKKMFELMERDLKKQGKDMLVMQLPSRHDDETALDAWVKEYEKLAALLEEKFGVTITPEKLYRAIDVKKRQRLALKRVLDTGKRVPPPIGGMRFLEIANAVSFLPDKEEGTAMLLELAEELEEMGAKGESPYTSKTPRILFTGVPTGRGSHKVLQIIEDCGANIACVDNCSVYKKTRFIADVGPEAGLKKMLRELAVNYLQIPCAVLSPNPNRYTALCELANEFSIDAVIELTWQGCHTYHVESQLVKEYVTKELGLPYLHLESDYSDNDTEQLRVRIEAFLEIVAEKKERLTV